jgi:arylsulfatase A-like enzyme
VEGRIASRLVKKYHRSPKPFFMWVNPVAPHFGAPRENDDPAKKLRIKTPARPESVRGRFDAQIPRAAGLPLTGGPSEADMSDKPLAMRDLAELDAADRDAVRALTRQRAEAISVLDHQVGRLVGTLKATGEYDDTVIMFTSDNGYFLGEHRMRQGKILPYEPSLRVPLLIRGPGIPAGQVRSDPFTMIDFAPTFLQIAGAQPEGQVDGVSLLDVAKHGDRGWRRGILTETGPREVSGDIAESDNFLVKKNGPSPLRFSQGVRTGDYLYVEHASRERELYDLRSDPRELVNLVARPSEHRVVAALAHELDLLRNCKGAQCVVPLPPLLRTAHPAPPLPDGAYD